MSPPILLQIGTNIDLQVFKFRAAEGSVANQFILLGILALVIAAAVAGVIFYMRGQRRLNELAIAREEARFRLLLSEANLDDKDRVLIESISASDNPGENIPLLESRAEFENILQRIRQDNPGHEVLKKVPALRQKLGYGFSNPRYAFDHTRMLRPGIKMRCTLNLGKRQVAFVTTIIGVSERQFYIRPPTSKGKPVKLPELHKVVLRVSRSEDAEYDFTVNVLGQTSTALMAIACAHSSEIKKMYFRNAPRIPVELTTQFYIVREEVAAERSHAKFKAQESQFALQGTLQDLSLGGVLVKLDLTENKPETGDLIVFRLPEAQIKEDLVSQVMGSSEEDQKHMNVHLQFIGLNELNRLKLNKFIQISVDKAQAADTPEPEPPPEAAARKSLAGRRPALGSPLSSALGSPEEETATADASASQAESSSAG